MQFEKKTKAKDRESTNKLKKRQKSLKKLYIRYKKKERKICSKKS